MFQIAGYVIAVAAWLAFGVWLHSVHDIDKLKTAAQGAAALALVVVLVWISINSGAGFFD